MIPLGDASPGSIKKKEQGKMDKMLVVVFDTETAAYEGLSALEDLHREGAVAVYSTAVVVKDASGAVNMRP
jgi:uncharacterized membrane protein